MKKRVLKLATSLATAGMLAMTGTVVVPANGEIVPAMTTETVEYTMPGNDYSALTESGDSKEIGTTEEVSSLEQLREDLENRKIPSTYVDINGCDIDVLAVIYDVEDLVSYSI